MEKRYSITKKLGKNRNNSVYMAFDNHLNRNVVLKKIGRKKEMLEEAEVLKQLKHPSIPAVYDVIKEEENTYIVMEYMEGENLLAVLENGEAFSEERAVVIGMHIAECLKYLHNLPEKIIYRDLKPANIIIDKRGDVKLVDFDSACYEKQGSRRVNTGTFGYSAPEQFKRDVQADERSDIYGLGTTMYHMLTGKNPSRPPYHCKKIRERNPLISESLEKIVEKCMAEDRERRYGKVEEVVEELKTYKQKKRNGGQRFKRRKRKIMEEEKNVFLTDKKSGGLFLPLLFFFGALLFISGFLFGKTAKTVPEIIYAKEEKAEETVLNKKEQDKLPLICYNRKREKIIIKEGVFFKTDKNFHMALPYCLWEGNKGVQVTVICKDVESGEQKRGEILLKDG